MPPDYRTRKLVEQAALDLREKHSALDWSATVDDLIEREGLSQERISPWGKLFGTFKKLVSTTTKTVKALLSVKEQLILIAPDLHQAKEPFAKGHELGHSSLKWHREILYVCDEHDLSAAARDQLEWEANLFSANVLLPEPMLAAVYESYPTSMETVLQLHEWSGASIETCANQYVLKHPRNCVLLVMDERGDGDDQHLFLTRKVLSRAALKGQLAFLAKEQTFPKGHVVLESSRSRGGAPNTCQLSLKSNPKKMYRVSILNTTYRVLAIVTDETQ